MTLLNHLGYRCCIRLTASRDSNRFIAFRLPAGQDKRAGRLAHPALLCSRSTTLELLLSVALSFVKQSGVYHPFCFRKENGSLFDNKVGSFSMIILMSQFTNWVHFR